MLKVSERCYSPRFTQSKHAHEETSATIVLSGWLVERVGSVQELAGPLSVVIKPRGTEHSNIFLGRVRTLQIVVPDCEVSALERAIPSLTQWEWSHNGASLASFTTLLRMIRISEEEAPTESAAFDALAALGCDPERQAKGHAPKWLMAIRSEINESMTPLSVRGLAASAGVHPVYLARQFRRWYGCSMTEYFGSLRLRRAERLMAQTADSLGSISHRAGFADHAHMCRVFRQEVGAKPTELRRLLS